MFHFIYQPKAIFSLLLLLVTAAISLFTATSTRNFHFVFAQTSSDAIAVRVIPNPEHHSAARWYREQGFTGSPQSLTVDGYEAIRDGRTVYVNVANVSGASFYTNIYLISYNQAAEKATGDIFGQILAHWKFNTNITSFGHCRSDGSLVCQYDEECPIGDWCDSLKARLIRDTKRLSDWRETKDYLENYYQQHSSHYPILEAGTYLKNRTLSVWPSWQQRLSQDLNVNLPVDPVNKLGECSGYNETTCWNEFDKSFAFTWDVYPDLPDLAKNSLVYFYIVNSDGTAANFCGTLESGLTVKGEPLCQPLEICLDFDNDGYGVYASLFCDHSEADCNDADPSVGAGSPENTAANCSNNIDDDCDGLIDCVDPDCFSFSFCQPPTCGDGNCNGGEDCSSCPADCGVCPTTCPDGVCDITSECPWGSNPCPADCYCGNGTVDCGEECDDGNLINGDGCDSTCHREAPSCTDNDGDRYIAETTNIASCGNVCGPGNNQSCLGNSDCNDANPNIYPHHPESCDGLDNDCDGIIDNGFTEESCDWVCISAGYHWTGNGGNLNCCGNNIGEAGPFEATETSCSDRQDNDCDGTFDNNMINPTNPDADCLPCDPTMHIDEAHWYIVSQPDCDQCDYNDDDDGDQPGDWSPYPGMADQCDSDCGIVSTTVSLSNYENGSEATCDDGIDNDCDGTIDCDDHPDCDSDPACGGCVITCTTDPGCLITPGANMSIVSGNCCGAGNCYDCDSGYVWDGTNCVLTTTCVDNDGDGHYAIDPINCPSGDDCNDDPANGGAYCYPGNPTGETCDTHDNDCNGATDEGCDDDGDGYCDSTMQLYNNNSMCPNTIFISDGMFGDDCEDRQNGADGVVGNADDGANIHPGAAEICDGVNNDCNSATTDENICDQDHDDYCSCLSIFAFGSNLSAVCRFTNATNATTINNTCDCDDIELTINPGAVEVCGDNIDNNCDGNIDEGCGCIFPAILPCTFP